MGIKEVIKSLKPAKKLHLVEGVSKVVYNIRFNINIALRNVPIAAYKTCQIENFEGVKQTYVDIQNNSYLST